MRTKWLALVMASLLSSAVMAEQYTCPSTLEIKERLAAEPGEGWTGMYETSAGEVLPAGTSELGDTLALVEIALYAGEPAEQAILAPDNADSLSADEGDSLWSFGTAEQQASQPLSIGCHYGGSGMGLFRKITTPLKSCTWHFQAETVSNSLNCTPL